MKPQSTENETTIICKKCGEIQRHTGTSQNGEYSICNTCNIIEILNK